MTVSGGKVQGPGGGIFNREGSLTLNGVLVTGNFSGAGGGGIATGTPDLGPLGEATLNNSEVSWNTSTGGGGGILNHGGTLTVNSSVVDHNTGAGGGGIASGTGTGNTAGGALLTLNKSVISDNTENGGAFSGGGGVASPDFFGPGFVTLHRTTVEGNTPDDCFPGGCSF